MQSHRLRSIAPSATGGTTQTKTGSGKSVSARSPSPWPRCGAACRSAACSPSAASLWRRRLPREEDRAVNGHATETSASTPPRRAAPPTPELVLLPADGVDGEGVRVLVARGYDGPRQREHAAGLLEPRLLVDEVLQQAGLIVQDEEPVTATVRLAWITVMNLAERRENISIINNHKETHLYCHPVTRLVYFIR